jgi:hypothetical protein
MGAENFANTQVGGKRAGKRSRVLLAARLKTSFGDIEGRLRDLSRKGALVECKKVPPVGSEIVLTRGGLKVPARVAWTGHNRVGLEFDCLIDEQEVLVQLGSGIKNGPYPNYREPWLSDKMTGQERKLAIAWGITVGLTVPAKRELRGRR